MPNTELTTLRPLIEPIDNAIKFSSEIKAKGFNSDKLSDKADINNLAIEDEDLVNSIFEKIEQATVNFKQAAESRTSEPSKKIIPIIDRWTVALVTYIKIVENTLSIEEKQQQSQRIKGLKTELGNIVPSLRRPLPTPVIPLSGFKCTNENNFTDDKGNRAKVGNERLTGVKRHNKNNVTNHEEKRIKITNESPLKSSPKGP